MDRSGGEVKKNNLKLETSSSDNQFGFWSASQMFFGLMHIQSQSLMMIIMRFTQNTLSSAAAATACW
jgi:hypothetical protein